jgi:uracil-DNA glycosylase
MNFHNDWDIILRDLLMAKEFTTLMKKVDNEYKTKTIYPSKENLFKCFELPYKDIKMVILGQDPYHGIGQAHGLAFSSLAEILPPSLKNIFKELKSDLGIIKTNGDLSAWHKNGVFLLNTILTVKENEALSHKDLGWNIFTNEVIKKLNEKDNIVFVLWGKYAQNYEKYLTNKNNLVIKSVHPSPLSAYHGFFGSKPFSKANEFFKKNNEEEIDFRA